MDARVFNLTPAQIEHMYSPNLSPVVDRIERQDPETGLVIVMTRHADNTFTIVDERYEASLTP